MEKDPEKNILRKKIGAFNQKRLKERRRKFRKKNENKS